VDVKKPLEAQFVAILIARPEFAKAVQLDETDFQDIQNAAIFQALQQIKVDVSTLTLAEQIKARIPDFDIDYLEHVSFLDVEDASLEQIQERANAIRQERVRQVSSSRLRAALTALADPGNDVQMALTSINNVVMDASQRILGQAKPTAPDILERAYQQKVGKRFPSGLTGIDSNLTSEGMRHGQVWILSASYKAGKTTVALNICDSLLRQGKSAAYICLEDTDISFTEVLEGIHSGVKIKEIEDLHAGAKALKDLPVKQAAALTDTEAWLRTEVKERWRVYDATYGVHDYRRFPTLVASDKILYDTDVVVIDYLQAWTEDRETAEKVAQMLVKVAAERQVCILALSQMSNDNIRNGSHAAMLGTKGSGAYGAAAHVGMELVYDPDNSTVQVDDAILKDINATGVQHFLGLDAGPPLAGSRKKTGPSELTEIGVWLKAVRRGRRGHTILLMDRQSGKIYLQYPDGKRLEPWYK